MKNVRIQDRFRRMTAVLLLATLMMFAIPSAFAQGDTRINLESANPSGEVLQLIFYSDAAETPSPENLKVTIGGTDIAIESVNSIDYANPGTSYLFLIDTNTAVTERALPDMQTIAKGIIEKMGALDNALIVPIGQNIDAKDFSDNKDALSDMVDTLTRGTGETDLYTSVSEAIKLLENDATLRPRRCLVVMADGLDNTATGISALEVSTQVSQSHVPLYLVALTYNTGTTERIEAAKSISGMARLSPGGVSILLKNDGTSTKDAVEQILAQRAHTFLAVCKSESVRAAGAGDQAEITLTQTLADGELSTTRRVSLAGLPTVAPVDTPAPESTPLPAETPLPTPTGEPKPDGIIISNSTLLLIGCAAALIAIAAVVTIIATKKRRRSSDNPAILRYAPIAAPQTAQRKETPTICIVRLGEKDEILLEGALTEPVFLGEGEENPILPKTEAERAKTKLVWRDGTVWAMQNGEGVLVNGVQARTNACLSVGDVLHLCGADYRIFYSAQG